MFSSVFRLFVKKIEPDYINIWNTGKRLNSTGSGFGIIINNDKFIMTNAHVVDNSNFIECVKYNSDHRYILDIVDIAYELDLALLRVDDNNFWNDIEILNLSIPPNKGSSIKVIGFPQNGENASITKGVISRLIPIIYNKSTLNLAIQVDSAINPGNSGGPVFDNNNSVVGIAFSHSNKGQNICYIIPSFIINYYINIKKLFNNFPGICDLEIETSNLNSQLRLYYLSNNLSHITGILVNKVNPIGNVGHLLKQGDIIYKIDDIIIYDDGLIYVNQYVIQNFISDNVEKVPYWHLLRLKKPNDKTTITIVRNKKLLTLEFKINCTKKKLIPSLSSDISRKYYIYCGLIFIPLNLWYLFDGDLMDIKKYNLLKYLDEIPDKPSDEIIIIVDILQSHLTSGYKLNSVRLTNINDKKINNLMDVYNICENNSDDFIKFEFENNKIIILQTDNSKNISESISQKYFKLPYNNLQ